jgi:Zn-dependent metalloprotease
MLQHDPSQCVMPPYILESIEVRGTEEQSRVAQDLRARAEEYRSSRNAAMPTGGFLIAPAQDAIGGATQSVHDAKGTTTLPGTLARGTGDDPTSDKQVDEAFDGAEATHALFAEEYGRDSLDGSGMKLVSTVHYGEDYDNAFWNGQQMAYGDGAVVFKPLTGSLAVIGHELSHGVVQFSGGLVYRDQSGALNESFADVFGALVEQRVADQTAAEGDWLIGSGLLLDGIAGEALRSLKAPGTAYDDPLIGTDPQPYHMSEYVMTTSDRGGVHINSGIPNHAFYLFAQYLGGRAWETAGHVWYDAMQTLNNPHATFADWATQTVAAARQRFGSKSRQEMFVQRAWRLVGVPLSV